MLDKNKQASTVEKTLGFLNAETLCELEKCYLALNPEKSREDFIKEFINPVIFLDIFTGDNILEGMVKRQQKAQENNTPASFKNGPLLLSTAYCLQSAKQLNLDNREMAWAYMVKSSFWHGVAKASLGIEVARTKTIHATRRNTAEKGAAARKDIYAKIKQEAFRLAREKISGGELWESAREAARSIDSKVLKYSTEIKQPLKEKSSLDRISKWLGEMPDADKIFKTFEKK